ncbi:MAG: AEC family transporter [Planctomycetota bacterium]
MTQYLVPYLKLLGWMVIPLAAGIALRRVGVPRRGSKWLFGFALFVCQATIVALATWVARLGGSAAALPFLALAGWLVAALAGYVASRKMRHEPRQRGAFICTICMSNHGYTLLGLVAMILFGREGLAQAVYTQMFIVPFLVFFCFPLGRYFGRGAAKMTLRALLRTSALDPRNIPIVAMATGLTLNLTGVTQPEWCATATRYFVYAGVVASGVAIGLLFRAGALRRYLRENAFSFAFRSSVYPLLYAGLAYASGLIALDTKILILFGLAPPAIFSNLVADFFGLDTDLTNSVFIVGTALFLVVVLPIYAVLAVG